MADIKLLMEGLHGAQLLTAASLCKSPDGGRTLRPLTESDLSVVRNSLNESNSGPNKALIEAKGSDGYLYVEGTFQLCDKKNGNGRIYERGLWETISNNKNLLERVSGGGAMGHLEHPKDGRTDLSMVSHVIVPISESGIFNIDQEGKVLGRAKILNTVAGKDLQELFLGGARVGISSRGKGSTYKKGGFEYVAKDYVWDTFDMVSTPSVDIAIPAPIQSSTPMQAAPTSSTAPEPVQTRESKEEVIRTNKLREEPRTMNGLSTFKQGEARIREISEALEGADAIKLSSYRDELLEMQMVARKEVDSDASLRDIADDLVNATKELRGKVTAQLEGLTDKNLSESVKKLTENKEVTESISDDVRSVLAKTHERMEFYRNKAQELAESENNVTRKEYEAACQLAEALLKKCKEFQHENKDLKSTLSTKDKELSEISEGLAEGKIVDVQEHEALKARYEKSLLIIEELAHRIRAAQVADRVEECVRQEPALARVRDVLLESKSVEEVNTKVGQMHKLLEGQMVYVPPTKPSRMPAKDLAESIAPVAAKPRSAPAQKPVSPSPVLSHRIGLIESIVGKRNGAFPK